MRLILIRHGETAWNLEHRIQGRTDLPLSDSGKVQAEALARALQHEPVEAIYTSPQRRAIETARAIDRFQGVGPVTLDDLRELDVGELDGLPSPEIAVRYPDFLRLWGVDAAATRLPGGESLPELQERAWESISSIRANGHQDRVVVVSHFFTILSLLCKVLRLSLSEFRRFNLGPASMTVVEFSGDKAQLLSLNDTCHLRP